jgi:hypothetical protein
MGGELASIHSAEQQNALIGKLLLHLIKES